ncbi:MAG: cupredoxin domain-containing protein [Acidimicrobiales bacterium]
MFSLASKLLFTICAAAVAMAVGYGFDVDERAGVAIFVFVAVAAAVAAAALAGATVPDFPPGVAADAPPPQRQATTVVPAPPGTGFTVVAAVAVTMLAAGAAVSQELVVGGVLVLVLAVGGWLGAVWHLHPTWTPRVRSRVSARLLLPVGLPVGTVLLALLIAASVSRIFLAISKNGAVVGSLAVALSVFGGCAWVASRPRLAPSALVALAAVAATSMIGAGIAGAVSGERDIEHHGDEHEPIKVEAHEVMFDTDAITVTAGEEVVLEFENLDEVFHNVAVYRGEGPDAEPVFNGAGFAGEDERTYRFEAPVAGTYIFVCDFHPNMKGAFVSQPAAAGVGGSGGHDGAAAE